MYPSIRMIARAVCDIKGLALKDLYQPRQAKLGMVERALVAYIAHEYGYSLAMIGRHLGRDHTTVLHHRRSIGERLTTDDALVAVIGRVHRRLQDTQDNQIERCTVPVSAQTARPKPLATGSVELVSRGKHWFLRSREGVEV